MWQNTQFPADLVTFTEETLMEDFIFCAVMISDFRLTGNEDQLIKTGDDNLKKPFLVCPKWNGK